jgi:chemotaxis signal transduction protein
MAEYLEFTSAGGGFAVATRDLRGVVERPDLSPVPLASPVIRGVFIWRGRLRTAVSPSERPVAENSHPAYCLVLDHPDGGIALEADTVGSIATVEAPDGGGDAAVREAAFRALGPRVTLIDPIALLEELRRKAASSTR